MSEANMAIVLEDQPEEAIAWYGKARERLEGLATTNPAAELRLSTVYYDMANFLRRNRQSEDALEPLRKTIAILQKSSQQNASRVDLKVALGGNHWNLGLVLRDLGRSDDAVHELSTAVRLLEPIVKSDPQDAAARSHLRDAYRARAPLMFLSGRRGEALLDWESSISLSSENTAAGIREERDALIGNPEKDQD
jgi:tetratricopeptide (TPR) repeat protein